MYLNCVNGMNSSKKSVPALRSYSNSFSKQFLRHFPSGVGSGPTEVAVVVVVVVVGGGGGGWRGAVRRTHPPRQPGTCGNSPVASMGSYP